MASIGAFKYAGFPVVKVEWFKGGHIPVALLHHVILPYDGKVDYRHFLVDRVFNPKHVPFAYNSVNGGSRFGMSLSGGSFYLSDWFKLVGAPRQPRHKEQYAPNYQVNCYDQAATIVQICLVLAFGGAAAQIAEDSERTPLSRHAFVQDPLDRVLDACAGPHYGDQDMNQYIQIAIDYKMSGASTVDQVTADGNGVSMLNETFGVTVERIAFVSKLIDRTGATSPDKVYDNSLGINAMKEIAQKVHDTKAGASINVNNVTGDSGAVHIKRVFDPPPADQISFTVSVSVFPNTTLAEKAIVVRLKSYGGELQKVWKTWAADEREVVDIVLVRDDKTRNTAFIITNGNALVKMWTESSKDHDVTSKQLTARVQEVVKLLADGVKAAANPQTAYKDVTWQVQEGHVVCVGKDKQNGALLFDARTAGTETITVWLGFDQARGSVKTQVNLNIQ
ncbi:hypothetical protein C8J57DRAFT_1251943 [Mycena rebaudengoi]|nr:hypothetical protein C8J57DRAFT_1251943 [Mycena rebaudengoi]